MTEQTQTFTATIVINGIKGPRDDADQAIYHLLSDCLPDSVDWHFVAITEEDGGA